MHKNSFTEKICKNAKIEYGNIFIILKMVSHESLDLNYVHIYYVI